MAKVAGTPEYAVTLAGDTASTIVGSDEDETAPLPHELTNTATQVASSRVVPRQIILFIFTKTPFLMLRHHSNNTAKVLVTIGILPKCTSQIIMLAWRVTRQRSLAIFAHETNLLQRAMTGVIMNSSWNSLSVSACWVGFIERPVRRKTAGPKAQHSR